MIKKKKITARMVPYRYMSDPMRRFVYGLLAGIENLHTSGLIKPKPKPKKKKVSATGCDGCRAKLVADPRALIPVCCPECGRHVSESIREFWFATSRRDHPAAGDYQKGFRRAKKS